MKFCPYCGASLAGSAVSFCTECGKQMPWGNEATVQKGSREPQAQKKIRPTHHRQSAKKRPSPPPTRAKPQAAKSAPKRHKDAPDMNYDGYYDDVQPIDAGQLRDRLEPELVKKIALIIVGAIFVVILAAVWMTLL